MRKTFLTLTLLSLAACSDGGVSDDENAPVASLPADAAADSAVEAADAAAAEMGETGALAVTAGNGSAAATTATAAAE